MKPEHMTELRAGEFVYKNHALIRLRGALDSLEAELLLAQAESAARGEAKAAADIGEALEYARGLMRSEVLGEAVKPMRLFGMDADEIRDCSHYPKKYYNVGHFMPVSADDGILILKLNRLRTLAREAELCAVDAFMRDETAMSGAAGAVATGADFIQAYNRLSSALYVMMIRAKAGVY